MATIEKVYNTWHEFVTDADQPNNLNPNMVESRSSGSGRNPWAGTASWEDTMHLAQRGWPEGLRRVKEQVHIIERFIGPRQPRKDLAYSVQGPGILDFSRYTQGRPDSWVVWEERDAQDGWSTRIVPILFNVSASSGISTEVLFHRGAAVCALIDILEHSRIRVELTIAECANYRPMVGQFLVKVKKSEEPADMDRIAFALCNASVLRRLMFSIAEKYIPNLPYGYGKPQSYHQEGALNLDAASLSIRGESDMIPWLVKQLKGFGIEVEG